MKHLILLIGFAVALSSVIQDGLAINRQFEGPGFALTKKLELKRSSNPLLLRGGAQSRPGYTVIPPPGPSSSPKGSSDSTVSNVLFAPNEGEKTEQEGKERTMTSLNDRDTRVGFIRKVYAIISCQLICTAGIALYLNMSKDLLKLMFSPNGQWIMLFSTLSSFLPLIILTFSKSLRHSFPINMAFLAWFTIGESILIGMVTAFYSTRSVVIAMIQTAVATLGLTLYSFQPNPKFDLTGSGQALFSGLLIFVLFGVLSMIFRLPIQETFYSAVGAFIFSLFLVYDTQMIVGGKNKKFEIDSKEYILAAINLYLDIVNLFLYLLRLFGDKEG